ncbi:unnamed protein product, partial [Symbiodinium sp. CCMP2456]
YYDNTTLLPEGWAEVAVANSSHGRGHSSAPQEEDAQIRDRYDKIDLAEEQRGGGRKGLQKGASGDAGVLQEVQKALTQARRADARLRKIQEEKAQRAKQWTIYKQNLKEKLFRQQAAYEQDLARLEEETITVTQTGQEAAARVRDVIVRGIEGAPRPEPAQDVEEAWNAFMDEDDEVPEQHGFLAEALQFARGRDIRFEREVVAPEPAPAAGKGDRDPLSGLSGIFPGVKPGGSLGRPPTTSTEEKIGDKPPSLETATCSASDATGGYAIPTLSKGPYVPSPNSRGHLSSPSLGRRLPVKARTKPEMGAPSGPTLQAKLDMKRGQAMQPFRVDPIAGRDNPVHSTGEDTSRPELSVDVDAEMPPDT